MYGRVNMKSTLGAARDGKLAFPGGMHIDKQRDENEERFFKRRIKSPGRMALDYLPMKKPETGIDAKYGPGDKVTG